VVAKFSTTKRILIWLFDGENNFFRTLETQIDETLSLGLDLLIWVFPKSETAHYPGFCTLVRSKLADNAQGSDIIICDLNLKVIILIHRNFLLPILIFTNL